MKPWHPLTIGKATPNPTGQSQTHISVTVAGPTTTRLVRKVAASGSELLPISAFPVHAHALAEELRRRGENMDCITIGGCHEIAVTEDGHTVAFQIHRGQTEAVIKVTLAMGRLVRIA
jgi:hypothetical protein